MKCSSSSAVMRGSDDLTLTLTDLYLMIGGYVCL